MLSCVSAGIILFVLENVLVLSLKVRSSGYISFRYEGLGQTLKSREEPRCERRIMGRAS